MGHVYNMGHVVVGVWQACRKGVESVCILQLPPRGVLLQIPATSFSGGPSGTTSAAPPGADPHPGLLSLFREDSPGPKARPHYDNYCEHLEGLAQCLLERSLSLECLIESALAAGSALDS